MAKPKIILGPVLSFRGQRDGQWCVTALLGLPDGAAAADLQVGGKECPPPLELLTFGGLRYWRYDLSCAQEVAERKVEYGTADGSLAWHFTVPGKGYAPRMAYVSCNGFSDPSAIRKLVKPADSVWEDLLANHDKSLRPADYLLDKEQLWHEGRTHDRGLQRFHLMLMGGDQIYFDSIWEELPELREWVALPRVKQLKHKVSPGLAAEIEAYYLNLYARRWLPDTRRAWGGKEPARDAADAMARVPAVMMWDDHDIFDGWGSYSAEMQRSPVYQALFRYARRAFWVFQLQHPIKLLPDLDPIPRADLSQDDPLFDPIDWRKVQQADALALPFLEGQPGFSHGFHMGPVSLLVSDLRTERSRNQVLGPKSWDAMQTWLGSLPTGKVGNPGAKCQHVLVLSSVPVAHPKLSLAEGLLDTFGQDHVTDSNADDLRDHWAHDDHEGERRRLLQTLTRVSQEQKVRVSIVSGDVHVAAWAIAHRRDATADQRWVQVCQFTSSAVVHPSLVGVFERLFLSILNGAASRPQALDAQHVVEMMLFPGHNRYVMAARNWLALELDHGKAGSKLWTTWRCESERGFSNHLHAVEPAGAT